MDKQKTPAADRRLKTALQDHVAAHGEFASLLPWIDRIGEAHDAAAASG